MHLVGYKYSFCSVKYLQCRKSFNRTLWNVMRPIFRIESIYWLLYRESFWRNLIMSNVKDMRFLRRWRWRCSSELQRRVGPQMHTSISGWRWRQHVRFRFSRRLIWRWRLLGYSDDHRSDDGDSTYLWNVYFYETTRHHIPEDRHLHGDSMLFWNNGMYLRVYTASQPRRTSSKSSSGFL
jgi:hypothetical protein